MSLSARTSVCVRVGEEQIKIYAYKVVTSFSLMPNREYVSRLSTDVCVQLCASVCEHKTNFVKDRKGD